MPDKDDKTPFHFSKSAEELIGDLRGVPFEEPRNMRKRPAKTAGSLVEDILLKFQIGRDSPEQQIRDNWVEIVGAANAHYSHAAQIDTRDQLIILAGHSVVRNELFMHRQTIVERIRKLPGCSHVRAIHVRPG